MILKIETFLAIDYRILNKADISIQEKVILSYTIGILSNNPEFFATNGYLTKLFKFDTKTITKAFQKLEAMKFITLNYTTSNERIITISNENDIALQNYFGTMDQYGKAMNKSKERKFKKKTLGEPGQEITISKPVFQDQDKEGIVEKNESYDEILNQILTNSNIKRNPGNPKTFDAELWLNKAINSAGVNIDHQDIINLIDEVKNHFLYMEKITKKEYLNYFNTGQYKRSETEYLGNLVYKAHSSSMIE